MPATEQKLEREFLRSLAVSHLPSVDLFALYDGILQRMMALEAGRITGRFAVPADAGEAVALGETLATHARVERQLVALRAQARREKQINRRVEINLEIQRIESRLGGLTAALHRYRFARGRLAECCRLSDCPTAEFSWSRGGTETERYVSELWPSSQSYDSGSRRWNCLRRAITFGLRGGLLDRRTVGGVAPARNCGRDALA